jgi:nucleotide-binding universal stress UspA family protein
MTEIKIEFRGGAVSRAIGAKVAAAVAGMLEALPIEPTSTQVAFRDENGPPCLRGHAPEARAPAPPGPGDHARIEATSEEVLRGQACPGRHVTEEGRATAKRILVPLDEAVQAESMVDAVGALARSTGATVRLLHVAPVADSITDDYGHVLVYADQESARFEANGIDYLREASTGLEDIAPEYAVRFGDPVEQILDEADAWHADLIAMATRGRGGIGRVLLGSVAEQVFRKASMAVTLYRASRELRA